MLLDPPKTIALFSSREEAYTAVQTHAREHGYAMTIARTKTDKTEDKNVRQVQLTCNRAGEYKKQGQEKRQTL
jgi:hypothetical protein